MEGSRFWEAISRQIEKMMRDNIESSESLKSVVFKVRKDVEAKDLEVIRGTLYDCLTMQRAILYMLFLITETLKQPLDRTLSPESQKHEVPRT